MTNPRRRHFAVERLSEGGQAVVRQGFTENWTLERILGELRARTGEELTESSLHRWVQWERTKERFSERQKALDTAVELIKAVPDARFITALNHALKDHLLEKAEELREQSAVELMGQLLRMEKLELAHGQLKVDETVAQAAKIKAVAAEKQAEAALTQADAAVRRVELMEKKLHEVGQVLGEAERAAAGGGLTPEVLKEIRERVYNITDTPEADDAT